MDERGKTRLTIKTWGKGFHKRCLFTIFSPQTFTMAVANVYDGGCKRLRWRLQTFAGKDANVCGEKRQCTARTDAVHCKDGCSALRERLQCTAGAVAVHCGSGCSALRLRWVKLASKSPVLFWIREQGGKMHLYPPGNICRALISDVERTNRKLSFLLAERRVSDILIFGCESVPASLQEKKG